jgi:adenylate kinase
MKTESGKVSRRRFLKESTAAVAAASACTILKPGLVRGAEKELSRAGVVVLLGPPGAGKSEQSRRLAERHSIPVISSGDLLRDHVRRGTPLGLQADSYMKAGQLVPDSLMNPILEDQLSQPDCARGFILDGYPRTLAQAQSLDALLKNKGLPMHVILLDVPTERLFKLLTGRRVCPRCNRSYNIYFQPPKKEGVCDLDSTPLVQRPDDKEEVIRRRLETYQKETLPAVEYYERQGRLMRVNGDQPPEKVAAEIESKLTAQ